MTDAPTFADRRVALGLTQRQLAERLGISRATLQSIERGWRVDGGLIVPIKERALYELALCELERRAAEGRL